jgi:tetratricopeptide (TPR) repeat protein
MDQLTEAGRLYAEGKYRLAEEELEAILASEPANPQARVMLGVIYSKTRRHPLAIEILSGVLQEFPQQFDSIVWLAMSKKAIGEFDEAIQLCNRALALSPNDPVAFNTLGLCYLSSRQVLQAIDAFQQAIKFAPRSAASYHNLGLALRLRDDSYEACNAFKKAILLDPYNEGNYLQLYRQQLLIAAIHDAILNLEKGYRRIPDSIAIQDALAISYCRTSQKQRGEALFKQIMKQKPGFCHSYSLWLQEEGRFKESIKLLTEWLEIEPVQGAAYFCLAEAKAFVFEDGSTLIERATAIIDRPKLTTFDRMYLSYALGKAYESAKQYEQAIQHFDKANELAFQVFNEGRRLDYDVARTTNDCLMDLYSQEFLAEYSRYGSSSETPIFIVGMIRSGTTLTDQIVSSHHMVSSAGEQPFWKLDGSRITHKWFTSGVDLKDIRLMERDYLSVLNAVAGPNDRISDKQPLNYELLGIIHTVFPKAKIIHIRRNPVDTCVSIYSTHFGGGPNFAYKQGNIVFHYREYLRLMEHWRQVLPAESFFELDYEQLVADKENVVRQVIDFCGLPWDDACLHHENKVSMVTTPSRWQARQPVYSTSVERWRNYEPWLGAFLELKDVQHPPPRRATAQV